jgi:hypothetical protein
VRERSRAHCLQPRLMKYHSNSFTDDSRTDNIRDSDEECDNPKRVISRGKCILYVAGMQPQPHGHEHDGSTLSDEEKCHKSVKRPALACVDTVGLCHLRPIACHAMWYSVGQFGNAVNRLAFRMAVIVVNECLLDSEDVDLLV